MRLANWGALMLPRNGATADTAEVSRGRESTMRLHTAHTARLSLLCSNPGNSAALMLPREGAVADTAEVSRGRESPMRLHTASLSLVNISSDTWRQPLAADKLLPSASRLAPQS